MPKCDESRIQQFLQDELSRSEQRQFEQHLTSCEICRGLLRDSTADDSWWSQAGQFLPDQPDDLFRLTTAMSHANMHGVDGTHGAVPASLPLAVRDTLRMLAPSDDPRMLGRIGAYEIAGVVGAGGMSVVLKAFDASLNRYVAIKVLAPHLAAGGAARQRFSREAQAAAAIIHENVIAIHGVNEIQGLPYLVMPYVKGTSLQKRLNAEGPLELKEILRIAKQTAEGLAAAHALGLVHRDVKPANILLAEGVERVTITDFGLARAADDTSLTRTGTITGTPQYMSPEQARGEMADPRSDLFSLGCVMYAMCTGRSPFRADTVVGVIHRVCNDEPRRIRDLNPDVPQWLEDFICRLIAKKKERRFQSASTVALLLGTELAHLQDPTAGEPARGYYADSKQNKKFAIGLSMLLLASTPFIVIAVLTSGRPHDENTGALSGTFSSAKHPLFADGDDQTLPSGGQTYKQHASVGGSSNWDREAEIFSRDLSIAENRRYGSACLRVDSWEHQARSIDTDLSRLEKDEP